jgi:ATP-binding cassette subfamily B protein
LIYRLYNADSGEISIGDTRYSDLSLRAVRSNFGVVPQDTVLFNESIEFNIRYGRPTASFDEVEDASKAADLHGFVTSHPDGLFFEWRISFFDFQVIIAWSENED